MSTTCLCRLCRASSTWRFIVPGLSVRTRSPRICPTSNFFILVVFDDRSRFFASRDFHPSVLCTRFFGCLVAHASVVSIPVPNTAQCALLRQYPRDCNVYDYFRLCCIPRDFPWDNLKVFVALPTMNHWIKSKAEVAGGRVLWQCDSSGLPWFFLRLGDTKAELSSAQNCAKKFHTCVVRIERFTIISSSVEASVGSYDSSSRCLWWSSG